MNDKLKTIKWNKWVVLTLSSLVLCYSPTQIRADTDPHAHHKNIMKNQENFKSSTQNYNLPNLTLIDKNGIKTSVDELFDIDKTVIVNFIFTSCNTICPIMSGTFARVDKELGKIDKKVELISITIDPEFDTPRELQRYSKVHKASENWKFYTGKRDDIIKIQTAFNSYRGSKMNHEPITLLRNAKSYEWIRIDGFASAKALIQYLQDDHQKIKITKHKHH